MAVWDEIEENAHFADSSISLLVLRWRSLVKEQKHFLTMTWMCTGSAVCHSVRNILFGDSWLMKRFTQETLSWDTSRFSTYTEELFYATTHTVSFSCWRATQINNNNDVKLFIQSTWCAFRSQTCCKEGYRNKLDKARCLRDRKRQKQKQKELAAEPWSRAAICIGCRTNNVQIGGRDDDKVFILAF